MKMECGAFRGEHREHASGVKASQGRVSNPREEVHTCRKPYDSMGVMAGFPDASMGQNFNNTSFLPFPVYPEF